MKTSDGWGAPVREVVGEGLEQDLIDNVLAAGAMWRAARAQPAKAAYWTRLAGIYSARARVLMQWDAVTWRWPQVAKAGREPGLFSSVDDPPE